MSRTAIKELHTDDIKIDQKPAISGNPADRESEIINVDQIPNKDYLNELAFNDEPVTIRLEPSAEKNAPTAYLVAVNGKGCEVFQTGRWREILYMPVGVVLITKRKYVAVLAGAKFDSVQTDVGEAGSSEIVRNNINRFTSAVTAFSIIEDKNPQGAAWLTELRRRNM